MSIHKANLAGGIVVGKQGTSVITLNEIDHNDEKQKKNADKSSKHFKQTSVAVFFDHYDTIKTLFS